MRKILLAAALLTFSAGACAETYGSGYYRKDATYAASDFRSDASRTAGVDASRRSEAKPRTDKTATTNDRTSQALDYYGSGSTRNTGQYRYGPAGKRS